MAFHAWLYYGVCPQKQNGKEKEQCKLYPLGHAALVRERCPPPVALAVLHPLKEPEADDKNANGEPYRGHNQTEGEDEKVHAGQDKCHRAVGKSCHHLVHGELGLGGGRQHHVVREDTRDKHCFVERHVRGHRQAGCVDGRESHRRHDKSFEGGPGASDVSRLVHGCPGRHECRRDDNLHVRLADRQLVLVNLSHKHVRLQQLEVLVLPRRDLLARRGRRDRAHTRPAVAQRDLHLVGRDARELGPRGTELEQPEVGLKGPRVVVQRRQVVAGAGARGVCSLAQLRQRREARRVGLLVPRRHVDRAVGIERDVGRQLARHHDAAHAQDVVHHPRLERPRGSPREIALGHQVGHSSRLRARGEQCRDSRVPKHPSC